jgi:predicted nucleic acid-binding protein
MAILLDTSVLIQHWHTKSKSPLSQFSEKDAKAWAQELIELHGNIIVTPVYIEFIAGTVSQHELKLALAYLENFKVADKGKVLKEDWDQACIKAKRVQRSSKRRHLGDCLIKAIADRLNYVPYSLDSDFPK